jgi:dihydrofolate synthase/folylpolyglutamate synthase
VPGRPPIVIDGAHNGASAEAFASTLRGERRGRRTVLVVGINRDKDAGALLAPLARIASAIVATRSSSPRAAEPDEVARAARRAARGSVSVASDIATAIATARGLAGRDGLVCVAGSLALAGDARTALGLPPPERLW